MKRYTVTIEYKNGRKNYIVKWASDAEQAVRLAMRDWGYPSIYESITAREDKL